MVGMTHFNDYTIMRPLVMDFQNDKNVVNISSQFMFGPSFMVCPVYQYGARKREVYLPAGKNWYDFYTGKHLSGGQTLQADAPYGRIPLFIPEGAIVPVGPEIQYTDQKPANNMVLYVYKGRDGSFTLYEDEGINYNYEKGHYATISFNYDQKNETLTIGERKGDFKGMLKDRKFKIIAVDPSSPKAFLSNASGKEIQYNGTYHAIKI